MEILTNLLKNLNINDNDYEFYGKDIAKIDYSKYINLPKKGKLILMTSINPTSAGEGKTTTAIGLTDGLNLLNKNAMLVLREPSLGPVFGKKGTATGGGENIVVPEQKINLHFAGDFHAITAANNLISAAIDNEIYWASELNIDPHKVVWKRCLDVNDRALREVTIKISKKISRTENFTITAASNMMTILSLAQDLNDLEIRLDQSLIAYNFDQEPIFLKALNITGSLLALLKEAINPNFVKTKHNSPALIHCGPFANIATGTNSIIATNLSLKLTDFTVIESGFGSDLGFEKFMNIINVENDLIPDCVVMVVTLRALNLHNDFENNFYHLESHLKHIKLYNLNSIVAINYIQNDDLTQLELLKNWLTTNQYQWAMNESYTKGPSGAQQLAQKVSDLAEQKTDFKRLINNDDSIIDKITTIAKNFYYIDQVNITPEALDQIKAIQTTAFKNYPLCMVKSHISIDGNDKNAKNYQLEIKEVSLNTGAHFILVHTNTVMSMPGLSKDPNYKKITLHDNEIMGMD